jgi:hypothetical protein
MQGPGRTGTRMLHLLQASVGAVLIAKASPMYLPFHETPGRPVLQSGSNRGFPQSRTTLDLVTPTLPGREEVRSRV